MKMVSFEILQNSSENTCAWPKPATLLKKRLWHRCFSVNFAKFLRTPFLTEHLRWLLLEIRHCHFYFQLDHSVTESYLGWVTSAYSLGRLLASIVFGYWSDKRRAMEPLIVSIVLLIVGSILYCYAEAFGDNGLYVVLIARIMQGMSSGINCGSNQQRCTIKKVFLKICQTSQENTCVEISFLSKKRLRCFIL